MLAIRALVMWAAIGGVAVAGWGQVTIERQEVALEKPLPDIPTLMHEVESHQRKDEAVQKNYLYHSVVRQEEADGKGGVKKVESMEYDHFWLQGVPVRKLVKKNGQELSADEKKKEDERLDKEVEKGKERREKADARGKETDAGGHEEITVSRFLELGSFTNPRRVQVDGRDTIAVDYAGDPKAKAHNMAENAVREMAGTIWVDEQDREIRRIQGRFVNNFKVGGGLVINLKKDTEFDIAQRKVNDEVWLPANMDARGAGRAMLLFSFNGRVQVTNSDYKKFKTTVTILPAGEVAEEGGQEKKDANQPQ